MISNTKQYRNCLKMLLVAVLFVGCNDLNNTATKANSEKVFNCKLERFENKFRIVVIDRCEYLYTNAGNNGLTVFHKGNCKYCLARNTK